MNAGEEPDTSDLCRSEIEKLRGQRPSIDRDASLALWLEHTTRNSSGRRDALEEAASLLTRATAIAERRDQYDGLDDLRRWRRRKFDITREKKKHPAVFIFIRAFHDL